MQIYMTLEQEIESAQNEFADWVEHFQSIVPLGADALEEEIDKAQRRGAITRQCAKALASFYDVQN